MTHPVLTDLPTQEEPPSTELLQRLTHRQNPYVRHTFTHTREPTPGLSARVAASYFVTSGASSSYRFSSLPALSSQIPTPPDPAYLNSDGEQSLYEKNVRVNMHMILMKTFSLQ